MRIVLTIGGLVFGGAERVMSNIANYLVEQGNDVMLITIHKRKPAYDLDNRIEFINGLNWRGKLSFAKICVEYRKIVQDYRPNVILSFLTQVNEFVIFATRGLKIPVIVSERNDPSRSATTKLRKAIRRLLYPMAEGVVFQTDDAMHYFDDFKLKNCRVIPNPIFLENELIGANLKRKKKIITAGRLFEAKNQKLLIEAFSRISNDYPEYTLTIYGDGELREELKAKIGSLQLQEKIFLAGSTSELHLKMKEAELFVLSSDFEGMPNVLMEAMACGMACISTDCPCGGPRYLIKNGKNGILIPVGGIDELENSLRLLINDSYMRNYIGMEAEKIYDNLKPEMVCRKWEQYLKEIAK